MLRNLKLIDTEALHLLNIIEHKQTGNSTHHYLRRLHNFALYLGWLVSPVMAEAAWPTIRKQKFAPELEEMIKVLRKQNEPFNENALEALYLLQERSSSKKSVQQWRFVYDSICMMFNQQK